MPNYACFKHNLHRLGAYYLNKALCEVSVSSLKDCLSKGRKSAKTHQLCIIMLFNPSLYNSLENIIFGFQKLKKEYIMSKFRVVQMTASLLI